MKCSECGLCMSMEGGREFVWQCNLTGESWGAATPAGINRACFAPLTAKAGFAKRLLGGSEAGSLGFSLLSGEVRAKE